MAFFVDQETTQGLTAQDEAPRRSSVPRSCGRSLGWLKAATSKVSAKYTSGVTIVG
jgi:hypothetical protein